MQVHNFVPKTGIHEPSKTCTIGLPIHSALRESLKFDIENPIWQCAEIRASVVRGTLKPKLISHQNGTISHCLGVLFLLVIGVRNNVDKLLKTLPDNVQNPNVAVTRANVVKNFIPSGNQGDSGHKGAYKNISEMTSDRTSFGLEDFVGQIEQAP
ncbi:hypothetical protein ACJ72_03936 [Emergomyces africanus]|uniref:Uncharacterized protein n=1 Tax=Emergomyces africanus TaxID=1955775 RepID=A0A1B7NY66_9EURO|nr:hypothetical protein ACJ72_03936 [Emergomyces africanus]